MIEVDFFYDVLVLHLRPYVDDPYLTADALMPTLIAAFQQIWDDGYGAGALAWASEPPSGNPYTPDDYPDWPRRHPRG